MIRTSLRRSSRAVEASHVFGRGAYSVRFDETNSYGSCYACLRFADEHKTELLAWAKKTLGEEGFQRLQVRAQLTGKQIGLDLMAVRAYYRVKIKQYNSTGGGR